MNNTMTESAFTALLTETLTDCYMEEISREKPAEDMTPRKITLKGADRRRLSACISALDMDAKDALYGRYVFDLTDHAITDFYGVEHVDGEIRRTTRILCDALGLERDCVPSERTLRKACRSALFMEMKEIAAAPGAKKRGTLRIAGRIAAAAALFLALGFGITFSVSAELRARLISWFIEDRTEYSLIVPTAEPDAEPSEEELKQYHPTYVPEGYELLQVLDESEHLINYSYADGHKHILGITITFPGIEVGLNTENMEQTKTELNGSEAYYYNNGTYGNLVFSLDGYACYITGYHSMDEMLKIANGIKK